MGIENFEQCSDSDLIFFIYIYLYSYVFRKNSYVNICMSSIQETRQGKCKIIGFSLIPI